MEGCRAEALLIDVGDRTHLPGEANSEEVEIVGMVAIFTQYRDRIQPRTVVMELPLDAAHLGRVHEIPVAPRASVITPVRNGGHVAQDCVQRDFGLLLVSEVFGPAVYFLLPCGIPGHLTAVRVRKTAPNLRALLHFLFQGCRLILPTLTLQI